MKRIINICAAVCLLLAYYLTGLYFLQNDLIFYPARHYTSPQQADMPEFTEHYITAADGTNIRTWFAQGKPEYPVIIFFHGNAWQIASFAPYIRSLVSEGYGLLMAEYRGFAGTEGKISQHAMYADAATVYDWIKARGYKQIFVMGYSFGCAASIGLAHQRPVSGLVLIAPFASLKSLVASKPVPFASLVLKDPYPSEDYIKTYNAPLLIIHGKRDRLIPYINAERLYNAATVADKTLVLTPDDNHVSVFLEQKHLPFITNWLNRHTDNLTASEN